MHRRARRSAAIANNYADSNSIGSIIEESSFSGLLTLVEMGHIRHQVGWKRPPG
jgi:hypothetical protein